MNTLRCFKSLPELLFIVMIRSYIYTSVSVRTPSLENCNPFRQCRSPEALGEIHTVPSLTENPQYRRKWLSLV